MLYICSVTKWFLLIGLMQNANLSGIIEVDKTYVGGKPHKENTKDDENNTPTPRSKVNCCCWDGRK